MPFLESSPFDVSVVVLSVLVAALVRGFSGFGAAMVFAPPAIAILGPTVAIPVLAIMDFVVTLPYLPRLFATRI